MTIPAGWYDDGSGRRRWWDGVAWTQHTVTTGASSAAPPSDGAGQQRQEEPGVVAGEPIFEPPYTWQPSNQIGPNPGPTAAASPVGYASAPGTPAASLTSAQHGSYAQVPPKKNISVLGVIGLGAAALGVVLSCIPPVSVAGWVLLGLGLVLSLISLFLRGAKWPGAAGLVVAVLGSIIAVAVVLLSLGATSQSSTAPIPTASPRPSQDSDPDDTGASGEESPAVEGAENVLINELEVGHCLPLIEWEEEVYELPTVPCDQPHTDEVYFIFDAPDGDYPGDDGLQTLATDACDAAFEEFIGIPYADSEFDNYWFVPTEASWNRLNDRAIQCIVVSYDEVAGTLEGAAR
jgi:hypothetical protein